MRARRVHAWGSVCAAAVAVGLAMACESACRGASTPPLVGGAGPLVCPHDAEVAGGVCRCAPGLRVLDGACVGPRELDAYCGGGGSSAAGPGTCRPIRCASTDAIDLATHTCAPASAARAVLARTRPVPDDLALGCREARALVLNGDDVACLPHEDLCPRDTAWTGADAECAPLAACAPGEIRTDAGCEGVVTRESGGSAVVDVGRWSRAMLGVDGGEASARLCRSVGEHVVELDVGPGGARALLVEVGLTFSNNDVTQVEARVETFDAASHQPVVGAGAVPAQRAIEALLVPLRALGGVADAASATVRVTCIVRGGSTPLLFPKRPAP
jgi:hypothetical protein